MTLGVRSGSLLEGDVTALYVDDPGLAETVGARLEREDDALTVVSESSFDSALERLDTGTIDCVVDTRGDAPSALPGDPLADDRREPGGGL